MQDWAYGHTATDARKRFKQGAPTLAPKKFRNINATLLR